MIKLTRKSMLLYSLKYLFFIFLICSFFAIVWLRSSLVTIEYEISNLETKKQEAQRETRILVAERAEILSSHKIKLVSAKEGLSRVDRTRILVVKRSTEASQASYNLKR